MMNRPHRKKNDEKRNAPLFLVFFHFLFFFTLGGFGGGEGNGKEGSKRRRMKRRRRRRRRRRRSGSPAFRPLTWRRLGFLRQSTSSAGAVVLCVVCVDFFFQKIEKPKKTNKQTNKTKHKTSSSFSVFGLRGRRLCFVSRASGFRQRRIVTVGREFDFFLN